MFSSDADYDEFVKEAITKGDAFINQFKAGEWKDRSSFKATAFKNHDEFCVSA